MKKLIGKLFGIFVVILLLFLALDLNYDISLDRMAPSLKGLFGTGFLVISAGMMISLLFAELKHLKLPYYIEVNKFELIILSLVVFLLGLVLLNDRWFLL